MVTLLSRDDSYIAVQDSLKKTIVTRIVMRSLVG